MKLYLEFTNKEAKDFYTEKFNKKGFETSFNSFGTLLVIMDFVNFAENVLTIENFKNQKEVAVYLKDVTYFEIQKGER